MQRSVFLFLSVVALSLVVYAAPPTNHGLSSTFTATDVATLKSFLQTKAESANIHDAFYATQALTRLDTKPTPSKTTELCTLAKNTLKDASLDAASIYHAASIAQDLKCDVTVDKALTDALKKIIEDGDSVPHYYYAILTTLSLREKTKKDVTDDELLSVVDKIGDLTESDGTVRTSTADKDGTLYNTGLALQLYAKLITDLKLSEQDLEHVDALVSKVETIVDLANEGENSLSFSSDDKPTLATTAEVVRGLNALSAALKKPLDVTPTQLAQFGEYFLSHRYASSLEDAYYLLVGLRAVQQSAKAPLALTVEKSSIHATAKGNEGHIKLKLTDIFDTTVAGKVFLVKSHAIGKPDAILLSNQELSDNSLNFLAIKPEQGFYALEFRAVPTDTSKFATIDSASRRVKVIGSVSVTDFEFLVSDSREVRSEGNTYKAEYPNKIDENIQVTVGQFIHAQFKVRNAGGSTARPLVAQQAFLRFTNTKTGHEAIFVATPNENKVYSLLINVDEVAKSQFRSISGEYTLAVVVGDAFIQNPISWTVSQSVSFTLGNITAANPRSLLAPKPEIKHVFRLPEKRPNQFTSTVFTGLVLAPLFILFSGFLALGANISKFPTGTDFFAAVGFVGTIAAVLLLIALYWFSLTLVQTLGYLAILSIPTIFFGNRALSALARKEKQQ